jgi:SAM-dependent methyltransferase
MSITIKKIIKKAARIILSPFILKDYFIFTKNKNKRFSIKVTDFYPQIKDKTFLTGFDRHYVYHVAWAVRKVLEIKPEFHTDISSSLYFCSTISASIPTKFYDYRPARLQLAGLTCDQADLTKLPFPNNSISSLSCMHTVEHIGLGRYGDPIDPDGDIKAINELKRILAPSGSLLFVVPIGQPKIEFNAHRIYSYEMILNLFSGLNLKEFYLIPEFEKDGHPIYNASKAMADQQNYACGCFWFKK